MKCKGDDQDSRSAQLVKHLETLEQDPQRLRWVMKTLWSFVIRTRSLEHDYGAEAPPPAMVSLAAFFILKNFGNFLWRTRDQVYDNEASDMPPLGIVSNILVWSFGKVRAPFASQTTISQQGHGSPPPVSVSPEIKFSEPQQAEQETKPSSSPIPHVEVSKSVSRSIKDRPLWQSYAYKPKREIKSIDVKIQVMERERKKFLNALAKSKNELIAIEDKILELNNKRMQFSLDSSSVD